MLTDRELEVRKLRQNGKTQAEIAKLLKISQPAVSAFERNAERKIKEAEELLAQLRKLGLLMLIVAMGLVIPHAVSAQIPSPGHPAYETGPGTNGSFYPGNYLFPGDLNVSGSYKVLDASGFLVVDVNVLTSTIRFGATNNAVSVFVNGTINATGAITQNSGFDVAEMFEAQEAMGPGDLVIATGENTIRKATQAEADLVIGAVSTEPGFILANPLLNNPVLVGLAGRIPVKVTGAVARGDFITVSATPGVGEAAREPGYVIGRAIGDVRADGTVLMIIQPQYFAPVVNAQNELSGGRAGKSFTGVPDVTAFTALQRGSSGILVGGQQLERTGSDVVLSLGASEDFVVTLG